MNINLIRRMTSNFYWIIILCEINIIKKKKKKEEKAKKKKKYKKIKNRKLNS